MTTTLSVFGLGYVGCVSAACFAKEGYKVIGVDTNGAKVDMINRGQSTIVEDGIGELIHDMVASGQLRATTDAGAAVQASTISLVCVGTPSRSNGSLDLSFVERVCEEIGSHFRDKAEHHTVVIRSTVLPGTIHEVVAPRLDEASGKRNGQGYGVCSNPEFLREGTSIQDFYDPPFTLIGADDTETAAVVSALYAGINAPLHVAPVRVAEMVKYASNSYHGLKIGFANEVGNICKAFGIDSHEVMRLFCEDRKLNISSSYLKPGFAFGGSCLPKDLRAVTYAARQFDIETPILSAILESNRRQIMRALDMIAATGKRRIGVLGLSFKTGTDDLRESPLVTLIEMLIGKGYTVSIYDQEVTQARLMGSNKEYIEQEIPHIWSLMEESIDNVLTASEVVVLGNTSPAVASVDSSLTPDQIVIDLARTLSPPKTDGLTYEGICW